MFCFCSLPGIMFLSFICILIYRQFRKYFAIPQVPKLEDTWWGPGDVKIEDTKIERFEIKVSDEVRKFSDLSSF